MKDDVIFLLDILVEDWDAVDDDVEIAPLPLLGTLADVVEAWRPHYVPNREGRHEFMQQQWQPPKELVTTCNCEYCGGQRRRNRTDSQADRVANEAATRAAALLLQEEQSAERDASRDVPILDERSSVPPTQDPQGGG